MARGECNRIVAVARYSPPGNKPGCFLKNVRPPIRGLPPGGQISRTREEANMSVQTALLPPSPQSSPISDVVKRKQLSQKLNQNGISQPSSRDPTIDAEVSSLNDQPGTSSTSKNSSLPACCGISISGRRRKANAPGTPIPARHLLGSSRSHVSYKSAGPSRRVTVGSVSSVGIHPDTSYSEDDNDLSNVVRPDTDLVSVHQSRPSRYGQSSSTAQCYSRSTSVHPATSSPLVSSQPRSASVHDPLSGSANRHNTRDSYSYNKPFSPVPLKQVRGTTQQTSSGSQYIDDTSDYQLRQGFSHPSSKQMAPAPYRSSRPSTDISYQSDQPIRGSSYLADPVT